MKRLYIMILAAALTLPAFAQQRTAAEYLSRYELLLGRLGPAGVGIETLVQNWEKDFPEDINMLQAKWAYYYTKAQSVDIVVMDKSKYLGSAPVLALKDSLGNDVNYFQKVVYDDELFGISTQAIDQAIKLAPLDLTLRLAKITAMLSYEGDSPDMTAGAVRSLIDYHYGNKPAWTYDGEPAAQEDFEGAIQEYCFSFYQMATPTAYEAFRSIAQKMIDYKSADVAFLNDLGTYYQVYKNDDKQALKYYNKVLKTHPDDYTAIKNCVLIARGSKDKKNERKYLQMLAKYAPSDVEKASANARLQALK